MKTILWTCDWSWVKMGRPENHSYLSKVKTKAAEKAAKVAR